jgi:hypothetical protein
MFINATVIQVKQLEIIIAEFVYNAMKGTEYFVSS